MSQKKLANDQRCHPMAVRRLVWAALIAVLILTPMARGSELITNGGFESWWTGWNSYDQGGGGVWRITTTGKTSSGNSLGAAPPSGNAAVSEGDNNGSNALVWGFVMPAGQDTVTLSFDLLLKNGSSPESVIRFRPVAATEHSSDRWPQ